MDNILSSCKIKPMVNQVLAHIGNAPFELIEYTQSKGILVEAYFPVEQGTLLANTGVEKIAKKYDVSIAQLCLKYDLQLDLLPLPKTTKASHMTTNAKLDFYH